MSMRSNREDMLAYAEKTGERLPWPEHGNWGEPKAAEPPAEMPVHPPRQHQKRRAA